jgi:hypothetical protein
MERLIPGICNDVSAEHAAASRVVWADAGITTHASEKISASTAVPGATRIRISWAGKQFALPA